jgi:hypothetical protein
MECSRIIQRRYEATDKARAKDARYMIGYRASVSGQLSQARAYVKAQMNRKIARIDELEELYART